jgi:hypothetical protein
METRSTTDCSTRRLWFRTTISSARPGRGSSPAWSRTNRFCASPATVTVRFMRPADTQGRRDFYGGDNREGEDLLAKDVPVSELQGTKGERGAANLPGDVRSSWAQFLVPSAARLHPNVPFDRAYDSLGRDLDALISRTNEPRLAHDGRYRNDLANPAGSAWQSSARVR